jgi:hypothetical protein
MITPLSMTDAAFYKQFDGNRSSPGFIGVFVQNGKPLPLTFTAESPDDAYDKMEAWLLAEREKLAKRESHLAYLRSDEAIQARKAAMLERKAKKAAAK